ncbi:carbohydrate ABC transporter substrate-binding protein [Mesorhizobium microcysteis]|uniref:Carbohydrate ABC transporter substrate-binding protein n=1 Tax=Neoaquamicrobium microcysteis TaxID=2682781 RepID=A0A5D4H467_9HYPH|nr:ABC transporter substrate-binding protein [Mesorhizobium microcysteis]TYR34245.1 carbohydrate ABC transporter substrate-binding protein [Mesorhizobium microcysteis]
MIATTCRAAILATSATFLGAGALSAQELQYWVYSDFAQGEALKLQQEFIAEFEAENPGVKIVISGRGDDDLTSGQIAGAASGTLPDVFMNGLAVGAQLVEVGALANIHEEWMAMPQEFRDQFDAAAIASCTPKPEEMYCIPYTGFGEIMYRNLTVLEEAGVDTTTPPATWEEWHEQMVKVSEAGKFAVPDQTQVFNSVASMYAVRGDKEKWGIDFEARETLIEPESMTRTMQMFIDMAPMNSGTSRNDQGTRDLFITNQLAFHVVGPWVNPTYAQAANDSGLKYDFVLVPGATEGDHGGIKSYEFVSIAPGPNREIAWKFASYITEKNQMARWAKLLSRYNANAAAMADPEVTALPLIVKSVEAVKYAMDVMPPYFVGAVPNCYRSIMTDMASAVADGEYTAEEGAEELIAELNDCLAR